MNRIDLNADLGERPELAHDGTEAAILARVSSANVACGGHAGDERTMEATIRAALRHGVAVGAHPGYPDREGFGRVEIPMRPQEIETEIRAQVATLARVALRVGARLVHVKPHGALYHTAMRDRKVAEAIARAVSVEDSSLVLVGLAGAEGLDVWRTMGFRVAAEAFADRRYEPDGTLRPRSNADAFLRVPAEAAAQALRIAKGEGPIDVRGRLLSLRADTICLHGDTPGAAAIASAIREALEAAGIEVLALCAASRREREGP